MGAFYDFVKSFCVIAISGGLVMASSPEGELKKYIKYIISLCVVCSMLSAFLSFSAEIPENLDEFDIKIKEVSAETENNAAIDVALAARRNIENEISALLCAQFGFEEGDIYTVVGIDSEDISAVKITDVTVFISEISEKEKIYDYVSELFLESANIYIMKKGAGR